VKIIKVVNALEQFAPLSLQADFDNAGLQIGLTEADVSGALLCLDVTEEIVDEAIEKGCNLIVSHHPLIFHKLSRISDENYVQRTVMKAIMNKVTIVAMHTNMDAAEGGVNYKMAEKLDMHDLSFFGHQQQATATLDDQTERTVNGGDGVTGTLSEPLAADDFILKLKQTFGVECVTANQLLRRKIERVALCGGAGDFLLDDAIKAGADAFVTGEMHYHQYFGHEQQIQIAVIGHYQSEKFTSEIFRDIIHRQCPGVECYIARTNTNPIIYL
jgi:dinuclear metal center YbgI/SA1388 family protein